MIEEKIQAAASFLGETVSSRVDGERRGRCRHCGGLRIELLDLPQMRV
jgi:hypothetical protein